MIQEGAAVQDGIRQDSYRSEIEQALDEDEQRIGDVYEQMQPSGQGRNAERISVALGLASSGRVSIILGDIDILLKCEILSRSPWTPSHRATMLRSFAKRHDDLSKDTKAKLERLATEHQRVAEDDQAISDETRKLETAGTKQLEQPGIYVYTLPHYRTHPVARAADGEQSNDRTYLKIGMSNTDVSKRVKQQVNTALPEPIQILRHYVFPNGQTPDGGRVDYKETEKKIHDHLNAADHNQNRSRGAGKEWFLTHLAFIDSTANLLGMVIDFDYESVEAQQQSGPPTGST
ncbi:MAG: GIY-YIG nuclease family protein [Gammaproteobacteria bacterium]|nr:GIY-YIG nuclease family protein [Gammaproteobacteria bacterium]